MAPATPLGRGMPSSGQPARNPVALAALLGLGVGLGVAVAAAAAVLTVIAAPLYALSMLAAGEDGSGLDHGMVRWAMAFIVLPVGTLAGVAAGAICARWYVRGARLAEDGPPVRGSHR